MRLQWLARLSVNANNDTIRVTWQVNTDVDLDLPKLFFDFLLLLRFGSWDEGFELS